MRASRARSVDPHAGSVVGARVVYHSAPIAFGMSQGCLCRMELRLVLECFATPHRCFHHAARAILPSHLGGVASYPPHKGDCVPPVGKLCSL